MCFEQKADGFLQLGLGAILIKDEDSLKDRLIQLAAHVVTRIAVQLVGVAQQLEPSLDEVGADAEVVLDSAESGFRGDALSQDLNDVLSIAILCAVLDARFHLVDKLLDGIPVTEGTSGGEVGA